jgi:hypothetical protein
MSKGHVHDMALDEVAPIALPDYSILLLILCETSLIWAD